MPWSYDPSQLATSALYQVRAEVQDTDPRDQQLQDEEIMYAISVERNLWSAAARCAEMIGRRLIRRADVRLGRSMQIAYTRAAQQYLDMAKALRCKALGTTPPFVGGMSVTDKNAYNQDTDLLAPLFTKTQMQNPWVGGYTSDSGPPVGGGQDDDQDDDFD